METAKTRKREYTYTVMTVITIFLMVVGHIGFVKTPNVDISYNQANGAQHIADYIIAIIYTFHMPLFFFVSGAVFGFVFNQKPYTFGGLMLKKTKRLIVPFYLTRFLFSLPLKLLLGIYALSNLAAIVKSLLLLGDLDHLWFLIVLFYIFIIAFFLRKYLFKLKIPVIILLLAALALYKRLPSFYLVNIMFAYIFYFYLGLVFNEYQEKITAKAGLIFAVAGTAVYIVLLFKSEWFLGYANPMVQKMMSFSYELLQALLGIGVIYGVSKALCAGGIQNTKVFKGLYKHGFNIYLLHSTLNYVVLVGFERAGLFDWVNQSDLAACVYLLFRLAFTYLVPIVISIGLHALTGYFKAKKLKKAQEA